MKLKSEFLISLNIKLNSMAEQLLNSRYIKPQKRLLGIQITKKRIIWTVIILAIIIFTIIKIVSGGGNGKEILTEKVKKRDIKQTVLATGQVVSKTDLTLAFKLSGFVSKVSVKEGQKVRQGQVLANLNQRDQLAGLTQARGALAQAEANYKKVIEGSSSQQIAVKQRSVDSAKVALVNAKISLENTKKQQKTLVDNAYFTLMNSSISAITNPNNSGTASVTISGTYTGKEQGIYKITVFNDAFVVTGLENAGGKIKTNAVPLGNRGLYISFSGTAFNSDSWTIEIPNTLASTYVANYNAYQAAFNTQAVGIATAKAAVSAAEATLATAKAGLTLEKAAARSADIEAAKARVLTANGQVQAAQASLENTIIRAPADGVITDVSIKPGEQAAALSGVIVLQDIDNLHVEANISEANIALLKENQSIDLTFDALGPDRHFKAKLQTINPASTVISGVVNYKVTASLAKLDEIKPGMTANLDILTGEKAGVLAIPQRAILNKDNKKMVRVITNLKKKIYKETEVTTGMEADEGLVEITSGLKEGQEIVTFIKK